MVIEDWLSNIFRNFFYCDVPTVQTFNITQLPIPRPCISQELCFNECVPNLDYETPEIDAMETLYDISLCATDKRPLWSGTMQMVHDGPNPGPSSVKFLPMINLDPGNLDCIYSTSVSMQLGIKSLQS